LSYPISTQIVHSPTLAHMLWVDCAVSHLLSGSGLARDELNVKRREGNRWLKPLISSVLQSDGPELIPF